MTSNNINWKFILNKIQEEKCILMLGPDVIVAEREGSLYYNLNKYLTEIHHDKEDLVYYSEDEFFSFKDVRQQLETYDNICDFYKGFVPNECYRKMAKIPFHCIVSLSPDILLRKTFESMDANYQFDYYDKKSNPTELDQPNKNYPILYNLLGCIEDEDTLVYTYDDLFEYLTKILGSHKLPTQLRTCISQSKSIIFLGFKYERWYLKLLLRLLELQKKQIESSKLEYSVKDDTLTYYSKEFKINFVDEDVKEFIDDLYNHCEDKGLIREFNETSYVSFKDEIKDLIMDQETKEAIKKLIYHTKKNNPEISNKLINLYSQYNQAESEFDIGIIDISERDKVFNKVKATILNTLNDI